MTGDQPERPLPERVTMGLLPYLNAHALDEDYALAAEQRGPNGPPRRTVGVGGAVALAVFAILALTAAVQTSRDSVSEERERRELISQVRDRKSVIADERRTISQLQSENRRLEDTLFRGTDDSTGLIARVNLLGLRSGIAAARGPGVKVVADDAPDAESDRNKVLDSDLQQLVNGLWQAGAEAISINGERLTALSAIRHAGSAITVNYTSLSRPYTILAIGNPDNLPSRFAETTSGQTWLDLQQDVGLRFSMRTESNLRLPGADAPQLRFIDTSGSGTTAGKEVP